MQLVACMGESACCRRAGGTWLGRAAVMRLHGRTRQVRQQPAGGTDLLPTSVPVWYSAKAQMRQTFSATKHTIWLLPARGGREQLPSGAHGLIDIPPRGNMQWHSTRAAHSSLPCTPCSSCMRPGAQQALLAQLVAACMACNLGGRGMCWWALATGGVPDIFQAFHMHIHHISAQSMGTARTERQHHHPPVSFQYVGALRRHYHGFVKQALNADVDHGSVYS